MILIAITHGIQPYGGNATGRSNPVLLGGWRPASYCLALFRIRVHRLAALLVSTAVAACSSC